MDIFEYSNGSFYSRKPAPSFGVHSVCDLTVFVTIEFNIKVESVVRKISSRIILLCIALFSKVLVSYYLGIQPDFYLGIILTPIH